MFACSLATGVSLPHTACQTIPLGMPKRTSHPLSKSDLVQFLSQGSDFAFEMASLALLRSLDLESEHAAAYVDPITNRIRSYDIRSRWVAKNRSVRFAVECKNLTNTAPLVIHATPRLESEAYHTVITRYRLGGMLFQTPHERQNVYGSGEPVGRQLDQPTKDGSGEFKSSDAPTYEKWLQAVNGCFDLLKGLLASPVREPEACALIPLLVVPAETLWQVDYDGDGSVSCEVRMVERATLILRHKWSSGTSYGPVTYDISHLEIVTLPALGQRLRNLLGSGGLLADTDSLLRFNT